MAAQIKGGATGPAKLRAVTDLVSKLTEDLDKVSLLPKDRNDALEELKIYGRDPQNADPIFTKDGISMLLGYGFDAKADETARAALRVLANAMVLKPETRQIFVDRGYSPKASDGLKSESWDDEFLLSRILFLSTYGTNVDLTNLIEEHGLSEHIISNLNRHVKPVSDKQKAVADPMEDMALGETLKLLFNVTHFCKSKQSEFTPAVASIIALLWKQKISSAKPLDPPFGPLVNSLLNLDLTDEKSKAALYPESEPTKVTSRLVELLDGGIRSYKGSELESLVTPVVSLLAKLYQKAPEPVKTHLKTALLPSTTEREGVLGKGESLSAKLLNNSNNPTAPALRDTVSRLLFDLSDKDASKFVENVGYGFASGFLFQNNVPVPESASKVLDIKRPFGSSRPVNPITGQFMDMEKAVDMPEMTQAEKEREAERLFVLFERLKKTGVVNVENPVATAVREGKFEELPDDYVEELD